MNLVVAAGEALVLGELALHEVELLLADNRRDGPDQNPFLLGALDKAIVGPTNRVSCRTANSGWPVTMATGVHSARVGRLAQEGS